MNMHCPTAVVECQIRCISEQAMCMHEMCMYLTCPVTSLSYLCMNVESMPLHL